MKWTANNPAQQCLTCDSQC